MMNKMKKMRYQEGGAVDSTDDISPEKLKEIMQRQKDAEMDANMQEGAENQNKQRVGGKAAQDEAAAKKAAAKKAAAKPMNMGGMVKYKKGGKVRGCGIATQGVRQAKGEY